MSRKRGGRNWGDCEETHPIPRNIQTKKSYRTRSQFTIRDMGAGHYEVTNATGYWWHTVQEADGAMSITETDCELATLNAYAVRAVKKNT